MSNNILKKFRVFQTNQDISNVAQTFVTPEMYGAVGDGSTNDATAIQNAINSGYPVFFKDKNYRVNSTISIPSDTYISGFSSSVISTTSNISIFTITGSNITIENLTFTGNSTGTSQTGIFSR